MHHLKTITFVLVPFLALGCIALPPKQLSATSNVFRGPRHQLRERLLDCIPVGTPRIDAESQLRSLGFEMTPPSELSSESRDSIHCKQTEKSGLFGQTTWLVQIDCPDGAVADIFCERIDLSSW